MVSYTHHWEWALTQCHVSYLKRPECYGEQLEVSESRAGV